MRSFSVKDESTLESAMTTTNKIQKLIAGAPAIPTPVAQRSVLDQATPPDRAMIAGVVNAYDGTAADKGKLITATAVPPVSPSAPANHRGQALFAPLTEVFRTTHGAYTPKQYQAYSGDALALCSTGDYDEAVNALQGTGYTPVAIAMPDGTKKAAVYAWVNKLNDTTVGPYNELLLNIAAVPNNAPAAQKTITYVDDFSLALPETLPWVTNVTLPLLLDNQKAIDVGRELLGTDKHPGQLSINHQGAGSNETFSIADQDKHLTLSGTVKLDNSPQAASAMGSFYAQLAAAFGMSVAQLQQMFASPPPFAPIHMASRLSATSPVVTWDLNNGPGALNMNAIPPNTVQVGAQSSTGGLLRKLGFNPTLALWGLDGQSFITVTTPAAVATSAPAKK
jgi:hypothetical protein